MDKLSGKFVLRLTPELHFRLKQLSGLEKISLNEFCIKTLLSGLKNQGAPHESPGVPSSLLKSIQKKWSDDLLGIALFGSRARGDAVESSDVDLLLVLRSDTLIQRSLYHQWDDLFENWPTKIISRYSPQFVKLPAADQAGSLWYEVALDGIVLWEKDGILSAFLRELRTAMAEGKMTRKIAHGQPYWNKRSEEVA
jgi:hypothetical protein